MMMQTWTRHSSITRSILGLGLGFVATSVADVDAAPAGPPGGLDVTVINDASQPVPVVGTIDIDNEVAVSVANDDNNPVPVAVVEDQRIPFQLRDTGDLEVGNPGISQAGFESNPFPLGRVPLGYRAVYTHASLEVCHDENYGYPDGTRWHFGLRTVITAVGETVSAEVLVGSTSTSLIGPDTNYVCITTGVIAEDIHIISEEDSSMTYSLGRNYTGAAEDFRIAVQGYLEPVSEPAP